ncbi:MAG: amino acid permease [Akkermansiaceae bacterium]|nr:amino acid permease [Akkermansiaceae bacterium]
MKPSSDSPTLRRAVSLPALVFYGVGTILGAGIYVLIGEVAAAAKYGILWSLAVAGLLAAMTACSFAILSRRFPGSAGEALYVQKAFKRDSLATLTGLAVALVGMTSCATMAVGMVGYLTRLLPLGSVTIIIFSVAILGGIAFWGVRQSVGLAVFITVIEVLGLVFIASLPIWTEKSISVEWSLFLPSSGAWQWSGVFLGAFVAFFAFIGFEDIVNLAEETKNPRRNLPAAIVISLVVAMVIYLWVAVTVISSIEPAKLSSFDAPLAAVVDIHHPAAVPWISGISVVAVLNGGLVQIIMASRVLYGLSSQGNLPKWFGRIHPRTATPGNSVLVISLIILLLALSGSVGQLARLTSTITLLIFSAVNLSCLVVLLRERRAGSGLPWHPLMMVIATLGTFFSLAAIIFHWAAV